MIFSAEWLSCTFQFHSIFFTDVVNGDWGCQSLTLCLTASVVKERKTCWFKTTWKWINYDRLLIWVNCPFNSSCSRTIPLLLCYRHYALFVMLVLLPFPRSFHTAIRYIRSYFKKGVYNTHDHTWTLQARLLTVQSFYLLKTNKQASIYEEHQSAHEA